VQQGCCASLKIALNIIRRKASLQSKAIYVNRDVVGRMLKVLSCCNSLSFQGSSSGLACKAS
jgi:hypothetical protein